MSNKLETGRFRFPSTIVSASQSDLHLSPEKLEKLKSIASPAVHKVALRAAERARLFANKHPFWNAIEGSYARILERFSMLHDRFPAISRVIHNMEVMKGDILVSDYFTGLNLGRLSGGFEPLKISVMDNSGDTLVGKVLRCRRADSDEFGAFKNELWYFISHRLVVIDPKQKCLAYPLTKR